jgi:hypothetical protein
MPPDFPALLILASEVPSLQELETGSENNAAAAGKVEDFAVANTVENVGAADSVEDVTAACCVSVDVEEDVANIVKDVGTACSVAVEVEDLAANSVTRASNIPRSSQPIRERLLLRNRV